MKQRLDVAATTKLLACIDGVRKALANFRFLHGLPGHSRFNSSLLVLSCALALWFQRNRPLSNAGAKFCLLACKALVKLSQIVHSECVPAAFTCIRVVHPSSAPVKDLVASLSPQQARDLVVMLDKLLNPTILHAKFLPLSWALSHNRQWISRARCILVVLGHEWVVIPPSLTLPSICIPPYDVEVCGGHANVVRSKVNGVDMAIKLPRPLPRAAFKEYRQPFAEAIIMKLASHRFVLPILGAFVTNEPQPRLAIVSPWCENKTIDMYLFDTVSQRPVGGDQLPRLLSELAEALYHIHSCGIVHNDLHPFNILISAAGHVQLSDFGIASFFNPSITNPRAACGRCEYSSPQKHLHSRAHETDFYEPYPPDDMFAFGTLVYVLYTGQNPFSSEPMTKYNTIRRIVDGEYPPRPSLTDRCRAYLPDALWDLVLRCWQNEPSARPTAKQALHILSQLEI